MLKTPWILGAVAVLATTLACGVSTPLSPAADSSKTPPSTAADGSTLKASAPTPVSPINNDTVPNEQPTLVINESSGSFANRPFSYQYQVTDDAGATVRDDVVNTTQYILPTTLGFDAAYRWRVRAVLDGAVGPWSNQVRFFTPKPPQIGKPTRSAGIDEWHKWWDSVRQLRNVGPTVSVGGLQATRADLLSVEADWQNAWRGDLRARIFFPVPNCNPTAANNPSPPDCAFWRTVDVGNIGQTWQWVVRDWRP